MVRKLDKKIFGNLVVINKVGDRGGLYLCKCRCGNTKHIYASNLLNGRNKSCGKNCKLLHKMSKSVFYKRWYGAKRRCNDVKMINYNKYGGRGIKMIWKSFTEFKLDMYSSFIEHCNKFGIKQTTLDRIDNNGNYCKENCRWATPKEQNNNNSWNRIIIYKGKPMTCSKIANEIGIENIKLLKMLRYRSLEQIVESLSTQD